MSQGTPDYNFVQRQPIAVTKRHLHSKITASLLLRNLFLKVLTKDSYINASYSHLSGLHSKGVRKTAVVLYIFFPHNRLHEIDIGRRNR